MCETVNDKNVFGTGLKLCCNNPVTGFYRNGFCQTGAQDVGTHVACAQVTDEFLQFSKSRGNDLTRSIPQFDFPGLKDGDKWCLCASRWMEAYEAGVAPPLVLEATHERMLDFVPLETLQAFALKDFDDKSEISLPQTKAGAYQFSFESITGGVLPLSDFKGQIFMVVNTASQCGFTKQYEDLQKIYDDYSDQGFSVIGVPCNDFGNQEPGDEDIIKGFVKDQFGVTFPMTNKVSVKGDNAHPFFKWASNQKKGSFLQSSPKWNFHKFLIDRDGQVFKSYGSHVSPTSEKVRQDIEALLAND